MLFSKKIRDSKISNSSFCGGVGVANKFWNSLNTKDEQSLHQNQNCSFHGTMGKENLQLLISPILIIVPSSEHSPAANDLGVFQSPFDIKT